MSKTDAVYVGDMRVDWLTASAAGVRFLGLDHGFWNRNNPDLERLPPPRQAPRRSARRCWEPGGRYDPPGLNAIIFDVDGILAETEEHHRLAFNAAFAEADLGWSWDRPFYADLLRVAGGKERIRHFIETTAAEERDALTPGSAPSTPARQSSTPRPSWQVKSTSAPASGG